MANLAPVPFEVDPFSGVVRTTETLDYETGRRRYALKIRASDWGAPYRRQTELRLAVRLRDVNDNRPQFERVACRGRVPRTAAIGAHLLTLSAVDLDDGDRVSYRVVAGNEDGCFSLDAVSCALFFHLARPLAFPCRLFFLSYSLVVPLYCLSLITYFLTHLACFLPFLFDFLIRSFDCIVFSYLLSFLLTRLLTCYLYFLLLS